jgi:SAM-dependent methyltransferase
LSRQAAFLGDTTERLFRAAGVGPGMRILDVGSGAGDVALLAAQLVGATGEVVGIDVDGGALEVARARSRALGLDNVTFVEGDVRSATLGDAFDAAVGRLVLMYTGDPREALSQIAGHVRVEGVVVFQELDLDPAARSFSLPDETLWNHVGRLLIETFIRAGMQARMGPRLFSLFREAGLSIPALRLESVAGGGPDFGGYAWMAGIARGLAPAMRKLEITDVERLGLETLADRLRDDAVSSGAAVWIPPLVGAFSRKPES